MAVRATMGMKVIGLVGQTLVCGLASAGPKALAAIAGLSRNPPTTY
jgi:hypothetical protein